MSKPHGQRPSQSFHRDLLTPVPPEGNPFWSASLNIWGLVMQRISNAIAATALLSLTACDGVAYQQPYAPEPLSMSQIQGQCFAKSKKFMTQTQCIADTVAALGAAPNPYAQDYLAYMQELQEKVQRKALSDSEARARLASKLTEVRSLQQNELAVQEQLENQRAAQNAEILRQYQYKAPQLEMPKRTPVLTPTVQTNCQTYGGQVNCTSRQW